MQIPESKQRVVACVAVVVIVACVGLMLLRQCGGRSRTDTIPDSAVGLGVAEEVVKMIGKQGSVVLMTAEIQGLPPEVSGSALLDKVERGLQQVGGLSVEPAVKVMLRPPTNKLTSPQRTRRRPLASLFCSLLQNTRLLSELVRSEARIRSIT